MQLLNILPFITLATAATLQKRCSPERDEAYYQGYLPPAPCWQSFTTACQPILAPWTEMYVSSNRSTAVVFGVEGHCFDTIKEEQARAADGRKTYGWEQKHGKLTRVGDSDVLVISNMSKEAVERYQALLK
ncbi:hypothetical protein PpBr36_03475 [Pyricularia pennisetigena]|uniref:hypothetical protein n=1 Tax=Pyricularia pennisetigena TaxID=1578925 RepID=UPI0011533212|nr:hypothetical protein PpBr36_03475 [Pyricularia pennisetigena]TLS31452.1 hypothetical protein PpBr36_03475 [Pyricularia pennisetigena]